MTQSLIDYKAVSKLTGLSRSTIYRIEVAGNFPKRIALSNRCVRWPLLEVEEWVSQQMEGRA
ncbi:MAG: AlpA family phage regulatory protein [Cycloclasticus sp.]|jgi:Predicted transcriptional regulator